MVGELNDVELLKVDSQSLVRRIQIKKQLQKMTGNLLVVLIHRINVQ